MTYFFSIVVDNFIKSINLFSSKNFKNLLEKKCSFLDNLSIQNSRSLKSLHAQKLNILFEQSSEKENNFQRNYSIFNKNISYNKSYKKHKISKYPNLLPNIKIVLTSPEEREYPEKYLKKDFINNNISGLYLKTKPINMNKNNNTNKNADNIFSPIKENNFILPIINQRNVILPIKIKKNITLS